MPMRNPNTIAEKWSRGMGNASEAIRDGVNAVSVNPAEKAAAAQAEYVRGVQQAVDSGKWQAGLRRTTLAGWKDAMLKKGVNRVSTGATEAKPKVVAFFEQFLPHLEAVRASLPPRGTFDQNVARMVEMVRGAKAFRRSR